MIDNKQLVKIVRKHAKDRSWCYDATAALEALGLTFREDKTLKLDKNSNQPEISIDQLRASVNEAHRAHHGEPGLSDCLTEIADTFGTNLLAAPTNPAANASEHPAGYDVTWSATISHDALVGRGWTGRGDFERFARAHVLAGNGFQFSHTAR